MSVCVCLEKIGREKGNIWDHSSSSSLKVTIFILISVNHFELSFGLEVLIVWIHEDELQYVGFDCKTLLLVKLLSPLSNLSFWDFNG